MKDRLFIISSNDLEPCARTAVAFKRPDDITVIGGPRPAPKAKPRVETTYPDISMYIGTYGTLRIGGRSRVIKETRTRPSDRSGHAPFKAKPRTIENFAIWDRTVAAQSATNK